MHPQTVRCVGTGSNAGICDTPTHRKTGHQDTRLRFMGYDENDVILLKIYNIMLSSYKKYEILYNMVTGMGYSMVVNICLARTWV